MQAFSGLRMVADSVALYVATPLVAPVRRLLLRDGTCSAESGDSIRSPSGLALTSGSQYLVVNQEGGFGGHEASMDILDAESLEPRWHIPDESPTLGRPSGLAIYECERPLSEFGYASVVVVADAYHGQLVFYGLSSEQAQPTVLRAMYGGDAEESCVFDSPLSLAVRGDWLYMAEDDVDEHPSLQDAMGSRILVMDLRPILQELVAGGMAPAAEPHADFELEGLASTCILSVLERPGEFQNLDSLIALPDGKTLVATSMPVAYSPMQLIVVSHDVC